MSFQEGVAMSSAGSGSCIAHIGETAGVVWRILAEKGPLSLSKLVKAVGEPRDTVMQAVGWLAREDKINIEDEGRTRMVSLR
jgi:DNA-binding transcriptional ArsR family regulator